MVCFGFGKNDHKFIATEPCNDISVSGHTPHGVDRLYQQPVAGEVSLRIVQFLEPVQVQVEQRRTPRGGCIDKIKKAAPVQSRGQGIDLRFVTCQFQARRQRARNIAGGALFSVELQRWDSMAEAAE